MNTITIELCKEDRARLDTIITALATITGQLKGVNAAAEAKGLIETKVVEEVIYTPDTATELPQDEPQEVEQTETLPEPEIVQDEPQAIENEPTVTKPDILQKVIALCGAGKKAEAKNIITTYADSVSDLPDSSLTEVWDKLTALEG